MTNEGLYEKIQEAVEAVRRRSGAEPGVGIILGTGLGRLAEAIEVSETVPYEEIPHFPLSTVESHDGRLLLGTLGGREVAAMQGRFHLYEGYSAVQVAFPVRVMKALGAEVLLVSNAAGGMSPYHTPGELLLIEDHINLQGDNPLIGPNDERLGPRFPDMSAPYSPRLNALVRELALEEHIPLHRGVYAAVAGPNLETRAEYRYLRAIGGDVVGMSTVAEVIAAVHMGMEVMALSVITDKCLPDALEPVAIEKIFEAAARAEPSLTRLMTRVVENL
ncbi:MAG: purine-nucleoside phosphorylase [bacterium]